MNSGVEVEVLEKRLCPVCKKRPIYYCELCKVCIKKDGPIHTSYIRCHFGSVAPVRLKGIEERGAGD